MKPRNLLAAPLAGLALLLTPVAADATTSAETCYRYLLPQYPGAGSAAVVAVDPTGRFQVGVHAAGKRVLTLWNNSNGSHGVSLISVPFDGFQPTAVNSAGDIAGHADGKVFRYRQASLSWETLPTPDGVTLGGPKAIAADGTIVAPAHWSMGWTAVVWSNTNVGRVLRPADGYRAIHLAGLDESGAVIGTSYDISKPDRQAGYWKAGAVMPTPLPTAEPGTTSSASAAEAGLAAGEVGGQKVLWELGTQLPPTPVDVTSEIQDLTRNKSLLLVDPSGYQALYQPGIGERALPIAADASEAFLTGATDEERVYGNEVGSFSPERAVWWDCRRTKPVS